MSDTKDLLETSPYPNSSNKLPKVLIVDDEPTIRKVLQAFLKHEHFAVTIAKSAEMAIDILKEQQFDVILSDVMMPGKSGTDFLKEIKDKDPHQEFILMTAYPKVTAAVHAIKTGAFEYVSKPFEFDEIKATIENALKHRQERIRNKSIKSNQIAGYNIIKTLGEGTMGVVFLVDKKIEGEKKKFAVKVIKNHCHNEDTDRLERFFREARSAGEMHNKNIIEVFEHGYAHEEGIPYIVMEFFNGKPLKDLMKYHEKYSYQHKIHIILQVARALQDTHEHNIVHRDIKPDNILVNSQLDVKLSDFGIAQLPNSDHTNLMRIVGTPYYLSPEAYNCPKVDFRADLYSLGTVAYELFTGQKPFDAENINALGFQIQSENPPNPSDIVKDFPIPLQIVLEKMMMKNVTSRYQDAASLIEDLSPLLKAENLNQKIDQKNISWNTLD